MNRRSWVAALLVFAAAPLAHAEVKLPHILGSHMVLQRDRQDALWGTAGANEKLTVALDGQKIAARADDKGDWKVELPATAAGGPHTITITDSAGRVTTLSDVLFGEVWVCSGQSNMEFALHHAATAARDIPKAEDAQLRLYHVPRNTSGTPLSDLAQPASWAACTPKDVPSFTAVGYYFGKELRAKLGVPVGLIESSWGGTPADAWTSRPALERVPAMKPTLERTDQWLSKYGQFEESYNKKLAAWKEAASKARAEHKPAPRRPAAPRNPHTDPHVPANLYNAMIAPLVRMPIRGAIWYQGESNVNRAAQYYTLFPAMIEDWRAAWHEPDMPFYFVQIAPYHYNGSPAYAELCDAQTHTMLTLPHTGMAVINDVGNVKNIHPTDKVTPGHRLAVWALAKTYGKDVVYSGPIYKSQQIEGDRIRIAFDHTDGGLKSRDGKPLSWFTIAGADHKFVPATAEVDGNTVVVHAEGVKSPVAVRFSWSPIGEPNLENGAGFPASLFRTDDLPLTTAGKG